MKLWMDFNVKVSKGLCPSAKYNRIICKWALRAKRAPLPSQELEGGTQSLEKKWNFLRHPPSLLGQITQSAGCYLKSSIKLKKAFCNIKKICRKRSFSQNLVFINLFYQQQCIFSTNLILSAYPLTIPFLLFFVRDILSWSFKTIKIRNIWKSLEISKAVVFFVFSRSHMEMVIWWWKG